MTGRCPGLAGFLGPIPLDFLQLKWQNTLDPKGKNLVRFEVLGHADRAALVVVVETSHRTDGRVPRLGGTITDQRNEPLLRNQEKETPGQGLKKATMVTALKANNTVMIKARKNK